MRSPWERTPPLTLEEAADCRQTAILAGDDDPESSHGYIDTVCEDALLAIHNNFDDSVARIKVAMAVDLLERSKEWRRWYA